MPKDYLDAVVSIGGIEEEKFRSVATGFIVGFSTSEVDEENQPLYETYLVTNKHVFEDREVVQVRFNFTEKGSEIYNLPLVSDEGNKLWMAHPQAKIDVGVVGIDVNLLEKQGIKYSFLTDELMAFSKTIKEEGIAQGDGVFILGFPMGIAGKEKNYVVVRKGIIARLDDEILSEENCFLTDSMVFPGNSGGPVVLKPEVASLGETKPVGKAYVLGVISGYIPFRDKAISMRTGEPRMEIVENSGLARVVPMDYVEETIEQSKRN
ncbi:hypothetical protein AKJ57_04075 [candidate division MSBL1 archaeon SCGC-AAA259A05]|uniref:Serine protease n=1 Tax=candidate division MSBL1 archaeon SCGC-AAA259A05 TaxID=1698259 RepID=A0A133U8Q1_9EURY|nr:hypothetical protein AKJ57_04075 [candidate division MSBL1 archaeon SCGC-AAA259A05]